MSLSRDQKQGMVFAASAFLMWGLAPLYFKALQQVPALEILVHRIVWSVGLLLVIIAAGRNWHKLQAVFRQPKTLLLLTITAVLLGFNWGLFIWAINNHHMLDASLGYYINPLLNILLGVLFLGERLRRWQQFAVVLAVSGVTIQVLSFGSFPVIAVSLASSFAVYGLLRKKMAVDSITGLLLEALVLLPAALIYWWGFADSSASNMVNNSWSLNLLLVSAGVVTTLPLLCFIGATKRLNYSTVGFFQYIGPSLMFLLAVGLYGEVFTAERLVTFACIWTALLVFSVDSWRAQQQLRNATLATNA